ncbi:Flagellar M-ring protein FliF [hydrothermal vent metagenome]|uniref:Flagellar M-ring protein FliF n=1 Tax=hydrothermal vent metagenome TaxID=652676 RepID=A0A3B1AZK1_9ZZZZ
MDLTKTDNINNSFVGMSELPVVRQIGLLVGLAASIAIGIAIVFWAQAPAYSVLFSNISAKDSNEVVQVLQRIGVKYQLDLSSGSILVDNESVQQARIELAAEGYPKSSGIGFELLQKDESIGTSTFLQNARYHRAKEEELARTINTIAAVKNSRVHLALPKDTVFIRDKKKARASVMLEIASGQSLPKRHIVAITHLVASSISDLSIDDVTVVDSSGNLLTNNSELDDLNITETQFAYTHKLEQYYIQRIENILVPFVGKNKARAQVVADIDFTRSESTSESFLPDPAAVRSEQRFEEQSVGSNANAGIPGALSNQPPAAGTAPEKAGQQNEQATTPSPSKNQRRSTLNYELDRTINHTKKSPTTLRRISVAVVIDDKVSVDKEGETVRTKYTADEMTQITKLVREAVGFSNLRGDSVNVINTSFVRASELESLPDIPIWEQNWFWNIVKQSLAGLAVLFLIFGVLKPTIRSLANYHPVSESEEEELNEDQLTLTGPEGSALLDTLPVYENDLVAAKTLASQEPKRVAQVVKDWISDE